MVQVLLKALTAIGMKLLASLATEKLLEWALFKLANAIVDNTETPHDNAFLEKLTEVYNEPKGNGK